MMLNNNNIMQNQIQNQIAMQNMAQFGFQGFMPTQRQPMSLQGSLLAALAAGANYEQIGAAIQTPPSPLSIQMALQSIYSQPYWMGGMAYSNGMEVPSPSCSQPDMMFHLGEKRPRDDTYPENFKVCSKRVNFTHEDGLNEDIDKRVKGKVYIVKGMRKKWDGKRFAKCCLECNKLAQGTTGYCKSHGGGSRCQFDGCVRASRGGSAFCATHGGGRKQNGNKPSIGKEEEHKEESDVEEETTTEDESVESISDHESDKESTDVKTEQMI